jgi:hypothetical protein
MFLLAMNALGAVAADGQYLLHVKSVSSCNVFSVMLVARVHAFCGGEKRTFIAMSFFSVVILVVSLGNFLVAQCHILFQVMITATLMILYIAASKCGSLYLPLHIYSAHP